LSAVKADPILMRLAREQAQAMAASGNMDHSVKGSFSSRMSHYPAGHAAENIAMGHASFQATLEQWKGSQGHRTNLLLKDVSRIGIASSGTGHKTYWSLILAAAPSAPPAKKRLAAAPSAPSAPSAKKHSPAATMKTFHNFILKLPFSLK